MLPVSLTTAAYVLYLQGTTFTTITLLGLAAAVCIVVDDVITDINAARGITGRRRPNGEAPVRAAFSAVRGPLVFATLALLLGTVPFLFLGSVVTAFSRPLVLAFALAVLASMVVSFLLTPTLGVLLLRGRPWPQGSARPGRWPGGRGGSSTAGSPRSRGRAARGRWPACWCSRSLAIIPQAARNSSVLPALQDRNLLLHVAGGSRAPR